MLPPGEMPVVEALVAEFDGLRFQSDGYRWFPLSTSDGPEVFTATRSSEFARTEVGAALAAIHIYLRTHPSNTNGYADTITEQVRGVGQAVYLSKTIESATTPAYAELLIPAARSQAVTGWTVTAFNPLEAHVTIYLLSLALTEPTVATILLQVIWEGSDWRLVVPDHGSYQGFVSIATDSPNRDFSEVFQ